MNTLKQVEDVLRASKVDYRWVGDRLLLKCVNPAHEDRNPSMFIYDNGEVYCFGCKYRTNISKLFGIKIEELHKPIITAESLIEYYENDLPEYPNLSEPRVEKGYFGLSKNILEAVDARVDGNGIIFPIYLNSKMIGWHKRLFNPGNPKYVSSPKVSKVHFTNYFYPLDLIAKESRIIVVEGVLDALAFIDHGFPAVSNFGLTFSKRKQNLLFELLINKVILGFDLDDAGMRAEGQIYSTLSAGNIEVATLPVGPTKNPRSSLQDDNYRRKVRKLLS